MHEEDRKPEIIKLSAMAGQEARFAGNKAEAGHTCVTSLSTTTTTTKIEDGHHSVTTFLNFAWHPAGKSRSQQCDQLRRRLGLLASQSARAVAYVLMSLDACHRNGLLALSDGHPVTLKRALRGLMSQGCLDVIAQPGRDPRTAPLLFFLRRELVTLPEAQMKFYALKPEAREHFLRHAELFKDGLEPDFLDRLKNYKRELVNSHAKFKERTRRMTVRGGTILCCDCDGNFIETRKGEKREREVDDTWQ